MFLFCSFYSVMLGYKHLFRDVYLDFIKRVLWMRKGREREWPIEWRERSKMWERFIRLCKEISEYFLAVFFHDFDQLQNIKDANVCFVKLLPWRHLCYKPRVLHFAASIFCLLIILNAIVLMKRLDSFGYSSILLTVDNIIKIILDMFMLYSMWIL